MLLDWLREAKLARVGCFRYEPVAGAGQIIGLGQFAHPGPYLLHVIAPVLFGKGEPFRTGVPQLYKNVHGSLLLGG